jgi:hypothetical protein
MANEIVSYLEMCQREGSSLQKGMNFRLGGDHSVILMSVRPNAPYRDRIEDDGETLIYEGHDVIERPRQPRRMSWLLSECASMRRSRRVFGPTTVCFIWWIPGENGTNSEKCSNLS